MSRARRARLLTALLAMAAVACAGIEGTGNRTAGIEGTGSSQGSASAFGSVFVNGVEFDTRGAEIVVNGAAATEDALAVGMVLQVSGRFTPSGGVATRIEFDRLVDGPIEALDMQQGLVTMLNQAVRLDDSTAFVNAAPDDLALNDLCAVSGYTNSAGEIVATRFQRSVNPYVAGATVVDAEGAISELTATSFRLGLLLVDYSGAVIDQTAGALANSAHVEVFGLQPQAQGTFFAQRGRVKNLSQGRAGELAEREGIISQFQSLGDFLLNGQQVNAASAQRTDNTSLVPANDVRVEVEGQIDADGVLRADRYALRPPSPIRYTTLVDSVDVAAASLSLFGLGLQTEATTQFQDLSALNQRSFQLDTLSASQYAELRGFRDINNKVIVTRIERRDASPFASVRGPLDEFNAAAGTLVIAGVSVRVTLTTQFFGPDGNPTTLVGFFASLQPGDQLEAVGTENNNVLEASEVRFAG